MDGRRIRWELSKDSKELIIRVDMSLVLQMIMGHEVDQDLVMSLFTKKEKDVLAGILRGKSNKEIAYSLNVSESTIKFHATEIFRKSNVGTRTELMHLLGGIDLRKGEKDEKSIGSGSHPDDGAGNGVVAGQERKSRRTTSNGNQVSNIRSTFRGVKLDGTDNLCGRVGVHTDGL